MTREDFSRDFYPHAASKMVSFFPSLSSSSKINARLKMFCEDCVASIMPYRRSPTTSKFSAELAGAKNETEKAQKILNEFCTYERHDLSEMLCNAVEYITQRIVWNGEVYFEIIEQNDEKLFRQFTSEKLARMFFWYVQSIPKNDIKYFKKRLTHIRTNKVWKISIPYTLGGPLNYKRMLKSINRYNEFDPLLYENLSPKEEAKKKSNFLEYHKNVKYFVLKKTKTFGWNNRNYSSKDNTEYYIFYKSLVFARSIAYLRDHIISELNNLLSYLSIDSKIIVKGVHPPSKFTNAIKELNDGKITFDDVLDLISRKS